MCSILSVSRCIQHNTVVHLTALCFALCILFIARLWQCTHFTHDALNFQNMTAPWSFLWYIYTRHIDVSVYTYHLRNRPTCALCIQQTTTRRRHSKSQQLHAILLTFENCRRRHSKKQIYEQSNDNSEKNTSATCRRHWKKVESLFTFRQHSCSGQLSKNIVSTETKQYMYNLI